jgi:hypothetical protein
VKALGSVSRSMEESVATYHGRGNTFRRFEGRVCQSRTGVRPRLMPLGSETLAQGMAGFLCFHAKFATLMVNRQIHVDATTS